MLFHAHKCSIAPAAAAAFFIYSSAGEEDI